MQKRVNQDLISLSLQGGGLDFAADISPDRLGPFFGAIEFNVYPYESLSFEGLAINFQNPHLADRSVRQALVYGTDRQRILEEIYGGNGEVLSGPFSPTSYCHADTIRPFPYQPSVARELLARAGYVDRDGDEVLESATGVRLRLTIKVAARDDNATDYTVCQRIASYLQVLGIEVEVKKLARDAFEFEVQKKHDFDLAFFSWAYDEGSNVGPLFVSNEKYPAFDKNYGSYDNPVLERIYDAWSETPDRLQSQAYGWEMHRILARDVPYLFLWNLEKYAIASRRLANVSLSPFTTFEYVGGWFKECD
jgi:peptide/nickel transport system substrate-binding protein